VSGFSAEWLALREPHDARARSVAVLDAVAAHLAQRGSIGVVDLACGTGATMRAMSRRLAPRQDWRLVDNDLGLLARAGAAAPSSRINVTAVPIDLARDLEAALDGAIDLVTTSALLDLVSMDWLERLVVEVVVRRLPFYAALSYDGKVAFDPPDPGDAAIVAAVNRHQSGDKGFGPALGPAAATAAIARFERTGYAVMSGASDWVIAPPDTRFQTELLAGWALAARETGDLSSADIAAWLSARRDLIGRTSMRVGHVDFFARPTGTR
jgi:hypothetical protein